MKPFTMKDLRCNYAGSADFEFSFSLYRFGFLVSRKLEYPFNVTVRNRNYFCFVSDFLWSPKSSEWLWGMGWRLLFSPGEFVEIVYEPFLEKEANVLVEKNCFRCSYQRKT